MAQRTRVRSGVATPPLSDVLELRVHGVNNTTAPALLDLRPEDVERVAGDKLGSFWRPTGDALSALQQGQRGYVPAGIVREAYSWGGMVRTTPDLGRAGAAGIIAATAARVLYALILPFSIGNAVQWARRITAPEDPMPVKVWNAVTAAIARLFGLVLTLLFGATAITLSVDVLAAQCSESPSLCGPLAGVLAPVAQWTIGQRFALFAVAPILAIVALWAVSAIARVRYDVLPGMEWHGDESHGDTPAPPVGLWNRMLRPRAPLAPPADAPKAVLSHPRFWSNRIVGDLARLHLAAVILLTTVVVGVHGAVRWFGGTCVGIAGFPGCIGYGDGVPGHGGLYVVSAIAVVLLIACIVLVCAIPTMTIDQSEKEGWTWHGVATGVLLAAAVLAFLTLEVMLVFLGDPTTEIDGPQRVYGGGMMVLGLVTAGAALAATGIFWRPFRGRRHVAWNGCGPALFMSIALIVAVATSAIVVVTAGDWLTGSKGAAALVRSDSIEAAGETGEASTITLTCTLDRGDIAAGASLPADCTAAVPLDTASTLTVPSSYVALGSLIVVALLLGAVLAGAVAARPRDLTRRARAWLAPASDTARIVDVADGVLPVSQKGLYRRIVAKRALAARLHAVEPLSGFLTMVLAAAFLTGLYWVWFAYDRDVRLFDVFGADAVTVLKTFLAVALPALAWTGLLLVAALASGAMTSGQRPLGIVWDIACFLPRTGHPFGPPSYAERAVPEIAGRMFAWLRENDSRRVILSAHSMGGVLAVSAIGLLASNPQTREYLPHVRLLTFGVQLRAFFGRMLPELLGPEVLGTQPSLAPRALKADPWSDDLAAQTPRAASVGPAARSGKLAGTLVTGGGVRWLSLWRLTDFLGFPAMSTSPRLLTGRLNPVDRFAEELDLSGYMVEVGTHGEYYRTPAYERAVEDLLAP